MNCTNCLCTNVRSAELIWNKCSLLRTACMAAWLQVGVGIRQTPVGIFVEYNGTDGERSICGELPRHPSGQQRPESKVLPEPVAEVVLDTLTLPEEAETSFVYVGQAYSQSGGARESEPFVRAVWFRSDAADLATGAAWGTHEGATRDLYEGWCEARACVGGGGSSGGGVQGATGTHTELGVGVMPGKGRGSIVIDEERSCVPFMRNP